MMTLTVFVQVLQKIKCKASSRLDKENKYTNVNNKSLPNLPLPDRPLFKFLMPQTRLQSLNGTGKRITFVIS